MKSKKHRYGNIGKCILAASAVLVTALLGVTHTKAADTVLYVEASNVQELYRQDKNYSYPEAPDGEYIFAGWFADANGETPLYDGFEDDTAYAKYVHQNVLGVKAQVTNNAAFNTEETVNMRFITSVDCLDYEVVGFDFVIFQEENVVTDKENENVYRYLAGIDGDGNKINYKPNQVFHSTSKWFMAYTLNNISNKHFGHGIIAKPYWITYDGTKVYGVAATKTVNMAYTPYTADVNMVSMTSSGITLPTSLSAAGNAYNLSTQGGCTDGTYWYQAYRDHNSSYVDGEGFSEDTNYDDDTAFIYKYGFSTDGSSVNTTVLKNTGELPLYHANDITYNSKLGVLVIAHGLGDRSAISFMNPDDLSIVDPADLGFADCDSYEILSKTYGGTTYPYLNLLYNGANNEIWSIEYNRLSDRYAVGISKEQGFYVLGADFAVESKVKSSGLTDNFTTQSIAADDAYIYSVLSNSPSNGDATSGDIANFPGHVIAVYSWEGSFATNINIDATDFSTSIEPESISIYNNTFYVGSYYSSKCYVYKVSDAVLESEYAALVTKEDGTEEYYFTLEAALMNADEDSTVTLLKDVTVTSSTTIVNDNVTLTNQAGSDLTITRGLASALVVNDAGGFAIRGNSTGSLTIDGASKSGGSLIKNNEDAVMTMEDVTIHSVAGTNTTTINGGVVYNYGDLTVNDCTFTDNQSTGRAAVLYLESGSVTDVEDCVFTTNYSSSGSGGAIYVAGEATIADSQFTGNYTSGNGGAINCVGGVMTVDSCDFTDNYSSGENGGAVGVAGQGTAVFEGAGTFMNNKADNSTVGGGGAIYTNNSMVTVKGSYVFEGNSAAKGYGGAIYLNYSGEQMDLNGATFTGNTALSADQGHAIYNLRTLNMADTSFTEDNADVIIATATVNSAVRYGRVFIAGDIVGANLVYQRGSAENTDRLSVCVGAGGLSSTSTVTLQLLEDDYVVGEPVLGTTGTTSTQHLLNATEVVTVCQPETSPTTDTYWHVGEDGTLCQGLDSTWATVGTSSGCDYTSLASAISSVDSGTILCVMTDLAEAETITVDKEITILSDPSVTGGVTITRTTDVSDASNFITISSAGKLTVRGRVALDGDKANRTGSASFVKNQGSFILGSRASIQNVVSTVNGAALYNSGTATIYGTFAYNEATGKLGGAIRTEGSSNKVVTEMARFIGNTAKEAGAISATNASGSLSFTTTVFSGNSSTGAGGGAIRANLIPTTIAGCVFENNTAYGKGGAIYATCTLTITDKIVNNRLVRDTVFDSNTSTTEIGGALHFTYDSNKTVYTLTMTNGTFQNNTTTASSKNGGAVHILDCVGNFTNVRFEGNSSAYNGGAMYLSTNSVCTITECKFVENSLDADAGNNGGAINSVSNDLTITDSVFKKNTARKAGAAIMANGSTSTVITGCKFVENSTLYSGDAQAGTVTGENAVVTVTDSVFRKNATNSSRGGAAVYVNGGTVTVQNATFIKNILNHASAVGGAAIYAHSVNTATITLKGTISFVDETQNVYLAGSVNTLVRDEIAYIPGVDVR